MTQSMAGRIGAAVVGVALMVGPAERVDAGVGVVVDPSDFPAGADISNAVPGVTLSALGGGVTSPSIFSSGSVFKNSYWTTFGSAPGITFRADFADPTDFVSIEVLANDGADSAILSAFDSREDLLEIFTTTGTLGVSVPETASISRASADINHITVFHPNNNFGLDNLKFNRRAAIPEPSPFVLGLVGAAIAGGGYWCRRRLAA